MRAATYIGNGTSLAIDEGLCIGCGDCLEVCPHEVIALAARPIGSSGFVARIEARGLCMECGACARNCPVGAIAVKAGVGCASAIIIGKLRGTEPNCDCGSEKGAACC